MHPFDIPLGIVTSSGATVSRSFRDLLSDSDRTLAYFYPKDSTPGCTLEARDFTRLAPDFVARGIRVIGISRDSVSSHCLFRTSQGLSIDLVSDPDGVLIGHFSVMGDKVLYGKNVHTLLRSTFLLDSQGNVLDEWRNVRAKGHAERIIKQLA